MNNVPVNENYETFNVPESLFVVSYSYEGFYNYLNPTFTETFNVLAGQANKDQFNNLIHPDDIAKFEIVKAMCIRNPGKFFSYRLRLLNKNRLYINTQWESIVTVGFDNEVHIFSIGYQHNDQNELGNLINKINVDLEKKACALRTNVVNQLNTLLEPLANVMGLVSLLKHEESEGELAKLAEMLYISSKRLDNQIKNIAHKTYDDVDVEKYFLRHRSQNE